MAQEPNGGGDTGGASLFADGKLDQAEALLALRVAAEQATEALPAALAACKTDGQKQSVMAERDAVVLAYLNSLHKSLIHTAPMFEKLAADLHKEAESVREKVKDLKNTVEAIRLFTELARLAASLALAFA